jgi:hypothetical protein
MGQTETAADETAIPEKPLDLAGGGVRRDIKVLRGPPQEQIADASPDEVADKAVVTKPVERPQGIETHLFSGYAVFFPGNDERLHEISHITPVLKSKTPDCFLPKKNAFAPNILPAE